MSRRIAVGLAIGDNNNLYAGLSPNPFDQSSMLRSTDGGQIWFDTGLSSYESGRSVIFSSGSLFCCGVTGVLKSSDRGITWHSVLRGIEALSLVANRNGDLFAGTHGAGVFRSTNAGLTWDSLNTGLVDRNVWSLAIDSAGLLYAGAESGLVHRSVQSTTSVHIADDRLPHHFSLRQNYPNPFNPTTVISYELPVSSRVTLKIFNVLGQKVATLVNGEMKAGSHQAQWDARGLASGVYLYQLRSGNFLETRKLILLR